MVNFYNELHKICSKLPRYKYPLDKSIILKNGIYIMFEKKEKAHGGKRIVRVGTHKTQNALLRRLRNHYEGNSKNSVFRKYIGSVLPNSDESSISKYIQNHISFAIIPLDNVTQLLDFEKKIIGTVSLCKECKPSKKWLGLSSPEDKIRNSGLWQVEHLCKTPLYKADFKKLKTIINKAY